MTALINVHSWNTNSRGLISGISLFFRGRFSRSLWFGRGGRDWPSESDHAGDGDTCTAAISFGLNMGGGVLSVQLVSCPRCRPGEIAAKSDPGHRVCRRAEIFCT